jgi:mannose-1-phosphate guanylyltransferase
MNHSIILVTYKPRRSRDHIHDLVARQCADSSLRHPLQHPLVLHARVCWTCRPPRASPSQNCADVAMVQNGPSTATDSAIAPIQSAMTKAVILVGGGSKATRFRPLSLDLPKPLFPIAGLPMIQHHVEALCKVEGLSEIILMGFFDQTLFQGFMDTVSEDMKIPVRYLREEAECGTAGGLYRYRDVILQGDPAAIIVLHCDIGCAFPLQDMLNAHMSSPRVCTVLGKELSERESHKYGAMVVDEKTSELRHYAEKPATEISSIVNAGVYIFAPAIFDHLSKINEDVNRGSAYRPYYHNASPNMHIEQDILMTFAATGRIFVFETKDFWCQIKDPAAALTCAGMYLEYFRTHRPEILATSAVSMRAKIGRVPSSGQFGGTVGVGSDRLTIHGAVFVHPTAKIDPRATIGPNVSIGAGVTVGPGVRLKNCIILEDVTVEDHAVIIGSIIGWGSSVGHWTRVQDNDDNKPSIFGAGVSAQSEIIVSGCIVLPHKSLGESCHNQIIL